MSFDPVRALASTLKRNEAAILSEWMRQQLASLTLRRDLMDEQTLRAQSREFLQLFVQAVESGGAERVHESDAWAAVRDVLNDISRSRGLQGFSPTETAIFVFSLRQPVLSLVRESTSNVDEALAVVQVATDLIDKLGLYTTEVFQKSREELIARQQRDMLELSTPVVKLWNGVLALPMIGTLDSERTQIVMESLLNRIVETGAEVAIIDITGVPTVDTLVAQHLLKTVTAARLMGADCIISGIRPQIAQTIVHLGVALGDVATKATLADAFAVALARRGLGVTRVTPKTTN